MIDVGEGLRDFFHAEAGEGGENEFAVDDRGAAEAVVFDEQGAVEVGPVDQRGELGGGADRAGRFRHAAEHDFQAEGAGEDDHLVRLAESGALHELDVDAVKRAGEFGDIAEALAVFVGDEREGAAFAEPRGVVELFLGHRLLDEDDALGGAPLDEAQGVVAVFPALVGVDGKGDVGDFADGGDEGAVGGVVAAEFYLDDFEGGGLAGFLADDVRGIDADGEGGDGGCGGVEAPETVPGGAELLADPVVEGEIDGGFGGGVAGGEGVEGGEDFLELEGIAEGGEQRGGAGEKRGDGGLGLAEMRGHGGLAVAGHAVVREFDEGGGGRGTGVGGDAEGVTEFEGVGNVAEEHGAERWGKKGRHERPERHENGTSRGAHGTHGSHGKGAEF